MMPEICLIPGRTSNREAAVIKHMVIFQFLYLLWELSYTFMSLSLPLSYIFWSWRGRTEKRSTHPTQYTSGAGMPWLSQGRRPSFGDWPFTLYVPTKNLSAKRTDQSLGRTMDVMGKASYADSTQFQALWKQILRHFQTLSNVTPDIDQGLWHWRVTCSLSW